MTELLNDPTLLEAAALLTHYSFDLGAHTQDELVRYWLSRYPAAWIRAAIIEALYQGRYKAVSVDHILGLWHRRRQPCPHFNHEFERIICGNRTRPFMTLEPPSAPGMSVPSNPSTDAGSSSLPTPEDIPPASDSPPDSPVETSDSDSVGASADAGLAFSEGGGIQAFKPTTLIELHLPPEISRHRAAWGHHPIDQFTPTAEIPGFYVKFQAVSQGRPIAGKDGARKGGAIATANPSE